MSKINSSKLKIHIRNPYLKRRKIDGFTIKVRISNAYINLIRFTVFDMHYSISYTLLQCFWWRVKCSYMLFSIPLKYQFPSKLFLPPNWSVFGKVYRNGFVWRAVSKSDFLDAPSAGGEPSLVPERRRNRPGGGRHSPEVSNLWAVPTVYF